jgi:hypothetical protein
MPVPTTNLQIKFEIISNLEFCGRQTSNIIGIIKKKFQKNLNSNFKFLKNIRRSGCKSRGANHRK